jgi:hypothetical protein
LEKIAANSDAQRAAGNEEPFGWEDRDDGHKMSGVILHKSDGTETELTRDEAFFLKNHQAGGHVGYPFRERPLCLLEDPNVKPTGLFN